MTEYYGYVPGKFPDTEEKFFGGEMHEAVTLLESAEDKTARLMDLLDIAWMRGHHAASKLQLREWESPYIHPDEAIVRFEKHRRSH